MKKLVITIIIVSIGNSRKTNLTRLSKDNLQIRPTASLSRMLESLL